MTDSTRGPKTNTEPTKLTQPASMLLLMTALSTSVRAFVPTIGGTFLGIAIDHWLGVAPIATIVCVALGAVVSILLIIKQIHDVRKPLS